MNQRFIICLSVGVWLLASVAAVPEAGASTKNVIQTSGSSSAMFIGAAPAERQYHAFGNIEQVEPAPPRPIPAVDNLNESFSATSKNVTTRDNNAQVEVLFTHTASLWNKSVGFWERQQAYFPDLPSLKLPKILTEGASTVYGWLMNNHWETALTAYDGSTLALDGMNTYQNRALHGFELSAKAPAPVSGLSLRMSMYNFGGGGRDVPAVTGLGLRARVPVNEHWQLALTSSSDSTRGQQVVSQLIYKMRF